MDKGLTSFLCCFPVYHSEGYVHENDSSAIFPIHSFEIKTLIVILKNVEEERKEKELKYNSIKYKRQNRRVKAIFLFLLSHNIKGTKGKILVVIWVFSYLWLDFTKTFFPCQVFLLLSSAMRKKNFVIKPRPCFFCLFNSLWFIQKLNIKIIFSFFSLVCFIAQWELSPSEEFNSKAFA